MSLWVDGYKPVRALSSELFDEFGRSRGEVAFERAEQRTVRVGFSDETPYPGSVSIYSPRDDAHLLFSTGSQSGRHGPFDWTGEELEVSVDLGQRVVAGIPTSALMDANREVFVSIGDLPGEIELLGVPPDIVTSDLVCDRTGEWRVFRADSREGDSVLFTGLPAGEYLVGPEAWLLGAKSHGLGAASGGLSKIADKNKRVRVQAGERTRLPWKSFWASETVVEGRVQLVGELNTGLILIPYYAGMAGEAFIEDEGRPRMIFGRHSTRVSQDDEGRYRFEIGEPVPTLMAACILHETPWGENRGIQIVEAVLPGSDVEIPLCSISIEWAGDKPWEPRVVDLNYPLDALAYPLKTFNNRRRVEWDQPGPLRIDNISPKLSEIRIGSTAILVELEPLGLNRVEYRAD